MRTATSSEPEYLLPQEGAKSAKRFWIVRVFAVLSSEKIVGPLRLLRFFAAKATGVELMSARAGRRDGLQHSISAPSHAGGIRTLAIRQAQRHCRYNSTHLGRSRVTEPLLNPSCVRSGAAAVFAALLMAADANAIEP